MRAGNRDGIRMDGWKVYGGVLREWKASFITPQAMDPKSGTAGYVSYVSYEIQARFKQDSGT